MLPVLLTIGRFKLYSLGSFIALGAMAAGVFVYLMAKARGLKTKDLFDILLYTLVLGLLGARLGYYLTYSDQFQSFWQILYFWEGGLLSLTGLTVGALAYVYYIRKSGLPIWPMLDMGALGLMLGWAIGSVGCHLSACSLGKSASFLTVNGTLPVDLFAATWTLVVFAVMTLIWQRKRLTDGVVFFLTVEAFLLGTLLIKTLRSNFGEGVARAETLVYLALMVGIYIVFWRLHGPPVENNRLSLFFKNLLARKP